VAPPLYRLHEFSKWDIVRYAVASAEANGFEWTVPVRGVSVPILQLQMGPSPALEFSCDLLFDSPRAIRIAANDVLLWRLTNERAFDAKGVCWTQRPFRGTAKVDCEH
jgi:hypothetical protein